MQNVIEKVVLSMKKQWKVISCIFAVTAMFSSCKFARGIDVDKIDTADDDGAVVEHAAPIVVEDASVIDEDAVLKYFFGQSKEELMNAGYLTEEDNDSTSQQTSFSCAKDGKEFNYVHQDDLNSNSIYFMETRDRSGMYYEDVLEDKYMLNQISKNLIDMYPKGELKSCSVEDVLTACQPLAQACGYGEAQADVYVMKHEVLNDYKNYVGAANISLRMSKSAPDPDYDYEYAYNLKQRIIKEAEAEDVDAELLENMLTEWDDYICSFEEKIVPWTEEHDAYLVVYQSKLNGLILDSTEYNLICVYAPAYDGIVYAKGSRSLELSEVLEEPELVTKEEAIAEAVRVLKIPSEEDITIKSITMIYSPRYEQVKRGLEKRVVDPCWRIDYELGENLKDNSLLYVDDSGTVVINAVDGRQNKYTMG